MIIVHVADGILRGENLHPYVHCGAPKIHVKRLLSLRR